MERLKNEFLAELEQCLVNHEEKESILKEYNTHLDELLVDLNMQEDESELRDQIYSKFGTPEEIATIWREELSVTPSNMKWLFIAVNILFFGGGSALTLAHNLFNWNWLTNLWSQMTSFPILIAMIYMFFWALLGYEIGKGFGHSGKKLMEKTFLLALIPNIILMVLTVFRIIPHEWFNPLLTKTFIIICILFTLLLYPVCLISYRWGKKASV
ncbi:HAAS signaling domain-containing protein [Bacillus sp. FSL K6-3431]|uniref:HAAS signaling domain-containing protein n=1 Tax=Bacillus sp. FSL K6-3431 TaxID=2921500 RepID=UPI0030F50C08